MDEDEALITLGFLLSRKRKRRNSQKKWRKIRVMWVRNISKQWEVKGVFHTLVQELQIGDREFYFK